MQQPCSRCGYISDRPARFCRQCGSLLSAENEVTSATTRNIAQQGQQSPSQFADQQSTGYAPSHTPGSYAPGGWAEQPANTSQFYQAPVAAQYQYPAVEQKKSFNWGKWILISFLTILLFTVLAGGALFFWGKQVVQQAIRRAEAENPGGVVVEVPPIPGIPPPSGAPVPEGNAVSLDSLKYPGSSVTESVKAPFTDSIRMTTDDDLETVKQYYDKKFSETFKSSATSIQSQDDEKYVYVSLSHPMITIEIEPDRKDDDKTRISIARVSAPIPKIVLPKELMQ
jgi:hypothetical protein